MGWPGPYNRRVPSPRPATPAPEAPTDLAADPGVGAGADAVADGHPGAGLRFRQVRRRFGRLTVLRGVSGQVGAGRVMLVTGANGSGKSTLLRCLAGLLAPDAGEIAFREGPGEAGGDDAPGSGPVLDAAQRRRRVGYVAPDLALYEELTTEENLAFFSRLRGVPGERGPDLLRRLDLPLDRPAGALSSGMRQKLRWAWALLHRPRMLLLDEPFQNLDSKGEGVVRDMLAAHLAGEPGGDGPGLAVLAQPVDVEVDPRWEVADHVQLAG